MTEWAIWARDLFTSRTAWMIDDPPILQLIVLVIWYGLYYFSPENVAARRRENWLRKTHTQYNIPYDRMAPIYDSRANSLITLPVLLEIVEVACRRDGRTTQSVFEDMIDEFETLSSQFRGCPVDGYPSSEDDIE